LPESSWSTDGASDRMKAVALRPQPSATTAVRTCCRLGGGTVGR
jgi:hypothetical protein